MGDAQIKKGIVQRKDRIRSQEKVTRLMSVINVDAASEVHEPSKLQTMADVAI